MPRCDIDECLVLSYIKAEFSPGVHDWLIPVMLVPEKQEIFLGSKEPYKIHLNGLC